MTGFLLVTNVLSGFARTGKPDRHVDQWLKSAPEEPLNGLRLANAATATSIPAPTVLGGSCVVMNELPLPLIQTSDGQISAQIPENLPPGPAVVQVRSLLRAEQSDPVVVTIRR